MSGAAPSPAEHVTGLINGFWAAQVINAACVLGLPDLIGEEGRSADQLATFAHAHGPSVFRLLRALETLGLASSEDGRFRLTAAGQLLRADAEGSVRGRALFTGDMLWKQFGDLAAVVRSGERTKAIATGEQGFAELAADPPRLHAFQLAMAEGSVRAARGASKAYDFGQFSRVLDLGGGYGGVLASLLQACPDMTGAVCDLGYLAQGAGRYLEAAGVASRSAFVAGDFFESVPGGYDAYVMKFIIHDWDDAHAAAILANVRKAAGPAARVVLLEQVVPDRLGQSVADQAVIRADLTMMGVGGKERTAQEYAALLQASGWRMDAVLDAGGGFSVVEAAPV